MQSVTNYLRIILKLFLPPIVIKVIPARLRKSDNLDITYEGVYNSFEQVFSIYGPQPEYSTDIALKNSVYKAHELINQFNNSCLSPNWSTHRMNVLSCYLSGFQSRKIRILDVGGGFAETYFNLKSANLQQLDYRIFELEPTVNACNEIFKDFTELKFYSRLEDLDFDPDVIHFGSSLQYFEDWRGMLNFVSRCGANSIIISDTAMGSIQTFIAAQVNMPGIVIPRFVFNIDEIKSIIISHGYELVHESSIFYPFHNFENYTFAYREIFHKNLIFKRVNT